MLASRAVVILASSLLVAACGPTASPKTAHNQAADPAKLKKVDLEFAIHDKPFPLPIVHGSVAGVATLILVDTGANSHVIAGWLARKAQLTTLRLGEVGVDHAGREIETRRAPHPHVHLDNWGDLPDEAILVADMPDAVAHLGIGAFLSPQQLATDDVDVVLDFPQSEMREVRHGDSVNAAGNALALDPPHACVDDSSDVKGLLFVVGAKVEGEGAQLLLDTGAHHSDMFATSKAGKAILPRSLANGESVYAASGKVTSRTVKNAKLQVGALEVSRDFDLIPGKQDDFCPRDGVLAMDVLKQCVLVLERHTVTGTCASDAAPK
ncbi:MAG TPA: aspartyl protease family protein [Polyangiaceae bacterium]|nr:aspartyl protease family protein [Polyangiaceae bacterium]